MLVFGCKASTCSVNTFGAFRVETFDVSYGGNIRYNYVE